MILQPQVAYAERPLPLPRLDVQSTDSYHYGAHRYTQTLPRLRSYSPSSEKASVDGRPQSSGSQAGYCLPSFKDLFEDVIAQADRVSLYYNRRSSAGSEHSWQSSKAAELSPASSFHTTPPVSPVTTAPSFYSLGTHRVKVSDIHSATPRLQDESERVQHLRRLAARRTRRTLRASQQHQAAAGFDNSAAHQPSTTTATGRAPRNNAAPRRERHFNKKYMDPDKLFIVYHKEDLKWGWPAIKSRRLEMLPILLGPDYDRSVEDHRTISGLDGMYYRENGTMPVLSADGSMLQFTQREGRWWECTKSEKCRGEGNGGGKGGRAKAKEDRKLWGMVERYPEEVVLHWNKVRCFLADDKRDEILTRAQRYSAIRARQRKQHDVPQWSTDNLRDRAMDVTESKEE